MDCKFDGNATSKSYYNQVEICDRVCGVCGGVMKIEEQKIYPLRWIGCCCNVALDWHIKAWQISQEYFNTINENARILLEKSWLDILKKHENEIGTHVRKIVVK